MTSEKEIKAQNELILKHFEGTNIWRTNIGIEFADMRKDIESAKDLSVKSHNVIREELVVVIDEIKSIKSDIKRHNEIEKDGKRMAEMAVFGSKALATLSIIGAFFVWIWHKLFS